MLAALAGNQNCGKTTLFNRLTGGNRRTGNFPGVTVEAATGFLKGYENVMIVDLPGVYSLSPCSEEEALTRDFLLHAKPDVIINIVDANNLNRNLYLTMQLLETGIPVVIALNMMDEVEKSGGKIDTGAIKNMLHTEVFAVSALKGTGTDELSQFLHSFQKGQVKTPPYPQIYEGKALDTVKKMAELFSRGDKKPPVSPFYTAIKTAENEPPADFILDGALQTSSKALIKTLETSLGIDAQSAVVDMRYAAVAAVFEKALIKEGISLIKQRTDRIDRFLTHRYLAVPIFFAVMGLIFYLTFGLIGKTLSASLSGVSAALSQTAREALIKSNVSGWLVSFIVDGAMTGVTSVLSFLPMIITLFFFLSVIEDSGYMARVAFVADGFLKKIGLNGKAVVPMLIGFGCSVPAYLSVRTLSSDRDKRFASIMVPFMPCSAKIPVLAMFTAAFFQNGRAAVMLGIYALSIFLGIVYALIMKNTAFKGEAAPFVLELPPYRMPAAKTVMMFLWDKTKGFLTKAFTVIFLASIAVWFFRSFTPSFTFTENAADSLLAYFSKKISFLFKPLGFSDWRAVTAIISGIIAKEAVVATLAVLLGVGQSNLPAALSAIFTPLAAMSYLVFCCLYIPCVAALAAFRKEHSSLKFAVLAMGAQTAIAYAAALVVYTFGKLLL